MANLPQAGRTDKYQINTGVYEGPLDLLLSLIENAELDITSVSLSQVTDQYIEYLEKIEYKDPTEISYFLVVAAKLIQIKSERLLPSPPIREPGEEDPAEVLAAQLLLYKRFKSIAIQLGVREDQRLTSFLHIAPDIKVEGILDLTGVTIADLLEAAKSILQNQTIDTFGAKVITLSRVTIREKIGLIISALREKQKITFESIIQEKNNRLEKVVTFLALLELVKQHVIETHQDSLFSEISLQAIGDLSENTDYQLEFGE